jgi:hypothetical protein
MWLTCTASKPPGYLVAQGGARKNDRMAEWFKVSVKINQCQEAEVRLPFDALFFGSYIYIILNIRSPSGTEWGLNGDSHYNPPDPPHGTPSGLPGLPGLLWDSHWTPSGLPWESHGSPSGLPPFYYCKYGESQSSPSGLPWDSQCSNCGVPGTELELDWEWTWTPRLLVAQCNVLKRSRADL